MGKGIVKLSHKGKDYYCEWSTLMDAPVTYLVSLKEFKKYYQEEYGRNGMEDFHIKIDRTERYGTSLFSRDIQELMRTNRAGPRGGKLSKAGIIKEFLIRPAKRKAVDGG